jgi:hypothetical protein
MKLTLSFARLLKQLMEGQSVNYGSFQGRSRSALEQFVNDGVLDIEFVGTQQKKVSCTNTQNLVSYLHHKFEISDLDVYISFLEQEDTERSDAVKAASNSKHKNTKVFSGFLINAYEEITCTLQGESITVKPKPGTFTFIYDYENFRIPADITVVGVEGHENFREIERQLYLFKNIKPLFVWRYQNSNAIADWLKLIPNQYLHFGDFDPKGIHIYGSEFRNKVGKDRCRFLIPDHLESLISAYGEKELFEKQIDYLNQIDNDQYAEVVEVVNLLKKFRKGLAQEILIH